MICSGTTLLTTASDAAVAVPNILPGNYQQISVINTGAAPGFFAADGGANDSSWVYVPASGSVTITGNLLVTAGGIKIKRIAGGTNMTGVQVVAN